MVYGGGIADHVIMIEGTASGGGGWYDEHM